MSQSQNVMTIQGSWLFGSKTKFFFEFAVFLACISGPIQENALI